MRADAMDALVQVREGAPLGAALAVLVPALMAPRERRLVSAAMLGLGTLLLCAALLTSALVAPVSIGAGAYIGSGSVVT